MQIRNFFMKGHPHVMALAALALFLHLPAQGQPSIVKVEARDNGQKVLLRNGEVFVINGIGGQQNLDELQEFGGNSLRTWGIESLEEKVDGKKLLDAAHERGLTVTAGIWLGHERHGFDYGNPKDIKRQREEVRQAVEKYKDHPALLMWGLGNEMEGPTSTSGTDRIWKELNVLAGIIKEIDPNHPVMTVIAGPQPAKIKGVLEHAPNIDVLGVNAYASAAGVGKAVVGVGWDKPFVLTEFGPEGHWEVGKTSWGAPIEPNSTRKASNYYATQKLVKEDGQGLCLGSYAFLWGNKQEATSTWYGMFLKSGEKLAPVDAMAFAWTGKWPGNRSPKIADIQGDFVEKRVPAGQKMQASVKVSDAEGDPLEYEWVVVSESTDRRVGGDDEAVPPSHPKLTLETNPDGTAVFRTPKQPGAYRLFVTVRDGQGNAATANAPFYVEG